MLIAGSIRRVKMHLYDTTVDCVKPYQDHIVVVPKNKNEIRVKVAAADVS